LAWNVWEHVNKADTLDGSWFDTGINPNIWWSTGFNEWNTANSNGVSSYWPLLDSWDNSKGIGQYYQSTTWVIFIRGGVADHSYRGGLFALHLGWYTLFEIRNLGFRCAR
jgi:hypothetical protein